MRAWHFSETAYPFLPPVETVQKAVVMDGRAEVRRQRFIILPEGLQSVLAHAEDRAARVLALARELGMSERVCLSGFRDDVEVHR